MKTNNMMALAINKSLLKEYHSNERVVYMSNGSEFQIRLFNPEQCRISAHVCINGEYLGNDIILRPGETLWLERHLDKARKLKFETYEVEDNEQVARAITKNGLIEVWFYKERTPQVTHTYTYPPSICWTGLGSVCTNGVASRSMDACYSVTPCSVSLSSCADISSLASYSSSASTASATIETGRIEEGSHSSQSFQDVSFDPESISFAREVIHVLPISAKPYTKGDLEKVYCTNCGRKIKSKFKFCPFCGEKQ